VSPNAEGLRWPITDDSLCSAEDISGELSKDINKAEDFLYKVVAHTNTQLSEVVQSVFR